MSEAVVIETLEHYERLIDQGIDPFRDPPALQAYMRRWDGPLFFDALGDLSDKDVLEIGVGTGRIAGQILDRGCRHLTGIDFSLKTIERARENLAKHPNVELVFSDVADFVKPSAFDVAYSVLTFMHIAEKRKVLENVVDSLKPRGRIILSVAEQGEWLDVMPWRVRLHYEPPKEYARLLEGLGCVVAEPVALIDTWISPRGKKEETHGKKIATMIQATKIGE
jgi:SAM-dependent methyltransferase